MKPLIPLCTHCGRSGNVSVRCVTEDKRTVFECSSCGVTFMLRLTHDENAVDGLDFREKK